MEKALMQDAYRSRKYAKLALSVACDIIGMTTFLIPGVGEVSDLIWAPLSSAVAFLMFGGITGALGATGNFVEEFLPGTDVIPSLTLTWLLKYGVLDKHSFTAFARRRARKKQKKRLRIPDPR
ncbi:MAG: hypothetical protein AAGN35_06950 [Bacteroidota bacterium]